MQKDTISVNLEAILDVGEGEGYCVDTSKQGSCARQKGILAANLSALSGTGEGTKIHKLR
jgi:hypothetical protein